MYLNGRGGLPVDTAKAKEYAHLGIQLHANFECSQIYELVVQ